MSARDCKVSPHAALEKAGGRTPSGRLRHTQAALNKLKMATKPKALRQPRVPPIHAPSGTPTTEATDQPKNTKVMARPRCAGVTSKPIHAAACGVNMAGDTTASTRKTISEPKSGASAPKPKNTAYHSMDKASKRLRSQPATTLANRGAPRHITTAAAVINCPATATETASELPMSFSVPGTTITPVPMTKLPNNKGHNTRGKGSEGADGVLNGVLNGVWGGMVEWLAEGGTSSVTRCWRLRWWGLSADAGSFSPWLGPQPVPGRTAENYGASDLGAQVFARWLESWAGSVRCRVCQPRAVASAKLGAWSSTNSVLPGCSP